MNERVSPRGAAAVACVLDLPPLEQRMVIYLRLWNEGDLGQAEIRLDLTRRQGPAVARHSHARFSELVHTIVTHARRPLQCHARTCPCAGGDECVFARFVALAAEGAREDAILIATLLTRADVALGLARLAEAVGLALMREAEPVPANLH